MALGSEQALAVRSRPQPDEAEEAGNDRDVADLLSRRVDLSLLVVDVRQAAHLLQCSRSLLYELIRAGELPTVKVGRLTRIPLAALHAFVERGGLLDPSSASGGAPIVPRPRLDVV